MKWPSFAVGRWPLAVAPSDGKQPTANGQRFRTHRFPLALIALLAAILFLAPLVRREVFTFRDHLDFFQPLRWFTSMELRAGHLPLWNPYNASGEPWVANPQTGVFYPPSWIFLALPFERAYILYLLFHVVLLGWSAYLLFSRSVSPGAAMVGAVALIFSGPVLSLLDVSNNLAALAWLPLALWCAKERAPLRGGAVLAMTFLAGEPFFAAVAAVMYVVTSYQWPVTRKSLVTGHRSLVTAAIVAIGISAIQLFPFLEMLKGSDRRAGLDRAQLFRESMPLRDWLRIAIPPKVDANGFDPNLGQHFIPIVYVGMIVALLALIGIVMRRRAALGWVVLLAIVVVVAAGSHLPTGELFARLPLTLFRYPSRVVPLAALAIAALAANGWDRIRRDKRWLDLVIVLLVIVDLVSRSGPLLKTAPFRADLVPYDRAVGADSKIIRVARAPSDPATWMTGYLNLYQHRFDADTAAPVANARYLRLYAEGLATPHPEILAFLPAGWILSDRSLGAPMQEVTRARGVIVYRDPLALPMATFWSHAVASPSENEAFRALMQHLGGGLRVTPRIDAAIERAPHEIVPANIEESGLSRVRVTVNAARDGVLVLAQQDAPGWRVSVDGVMREKLLAHGIFRAVAVRAGRHEVVWTYRPRSLFIGALMTFITLASLQLRAFVKRARREKFLYLLRKN